MGYCKSEEFVSKEDLAQTSAHIGLVAKVSVCIHQMFNSAKLKSTQFCFQIFGWRCSRRFGRWHHCRIDSHSTSSCLFRNCRPCSSCKRWNYSFSFAPTIYRLIFFVSLLFSSVYTVHFWDAFRTSYSVRAKTYPWDRQQSLHCSHSRQLAVYGNEPYCCHF